MVPYGPKWVECKFRGSGVQAIKLAFELPHNSDMEEMEMAEHLQMLHSLTLDLYFDPLGLYFDWDPLGLHFDWTMEMTRLQSLTFGREFNQSMENVTLPSGLQSLTFGYAFNQSMENVVLPSDLQSLTFGVMFNQSMDNVTLPSGSQVFRS